MDLGIDKKFNERIEIEKEKKKRKKKKKEKKKPFSFSLLLQNKLFCYVQRDRHYSKQCTCAEHYSNFRTAISIRKLDISCQSICCIIDKNQLFLK